VSRFQLNGTSGKDHQGRTSDADSHRREWRARHDGPAAGNVTDGQPAGVPVKAVHITELRAAIDAAARR
jgi:hypothetical protein